MQYTGFYINMDRNEERRGHVEKQLSEYNIKPRYARFPACDGNALNVKAPKISPGNTGCFCSHYQLLRSQIGAPTHIHVVEDDVVFSPFTAAILDTVLAKGMPGDFDMLYTDVFVPLNFTHLRDLMMRFRKSTTVGADGTVVNVNNFDVISLKDRVFACTSSYVVNRNSIGKLAAVLEEAVQSEIPLPIDLYYRQKTYEGRITAACLFPFITCVDVPLSQASATRPGPGRRLETSQLAATLLRNLFFVHSKPRELLAACESSFANGPMDDRDKVLASISRFALSPDYEVF
jgi:GR25 family glycosyltransferase involved in LPS biosynthesis